MTKYNKYGIDIEKIKEQAKKNTKYIITNQSQYDKTFKEQYNRLYQQEVRRIKEERSNNFLKLINNSAYNFFQEYGLDITGNEYFQISINKKCYKNLIKQYLTNIIPHLEQELGITGIKIKPNITPLSRNLLDFSNITITNNNTKYNQTI